jgi:hypothetical protein
MLGPRCVCKQKGATRVDGPVWWMVTAFHTWCYQYCCNLHLLLAVLLPLCDCGHSGVTQRQLCLHRGCTA